VYVDQGISADTFYSGKFFRSADPEQDGKVPVTLIAKNLMLAHKWGVKSFYYDLRDKQSSREMTKSPEEAKTKLDPANSTPSTSDYIQGADDEYCESCVL
jgi:ribonucleotide reductase alpha subunit